MNNYINNLRWLMIIWIIAIMVILGLTGAPLWVSVLAAVWMLYKENE